MWVPLSGWGGVQPGGKGTGSPRGVSKASSHGGGVRRRLCAQLPNEMQALVSVGWPTSPLEVTSKVPPAARRASGQGLNEWRALHPLRGHWSSTPDARRALVVK